MWDWSGEIYGNGRQKMRNEIPKNKDNESMSVEDFLKLEDK